MTPQEAIKILHPDTTVAAIAEIEYYAGFKGREATIKAVEDACVVACEALEKQIPKKPHKINIANASWCKGGIRFECPFCHKILRYGELTCCGLCGQHIDWSE